MSIASVSFTCLNATPRAKRHVGLHGHTADGASRSCAHPDLVGRRLQRPGFADLHPPVPVIGASAAARLLAAGTISRSAGAPEKRGPIVSPVRVIRSSEALLRISRMIH